MKVIVRGANRFGRVAWAALAVCAALTCSSCGEPASDGVDNTNTDVETGDLGGSLADSDGVADTGSAQDGGAAPDIQLDCPGGPFCPCTQHNECDTSLCIATPDGSVCAQTCIESCPTGYKCSLVNAPGGDTVNICVAKWGKLCDPCAQDKDCASLGNDAAACVDHGADGGFCSIPCAKGDCPLGYACKPTFTFDGVKSDRCIPEADGAAAQCTCSANAITKKLKTTCFIEVKSDSGAVVGKCAGARTCGESGLSACQAPPAVAEICDGEDNDCDGQTDEGTCDDGNACTQDQCDAKKSLDGGDGCVHLVSEAPCDADDNVCTEGDACKDGNCAPGSAKNCDDSNPCTKDVCLPASGCTQTDDEGAPCDDDNPCTQSDLCQGGGCEPGIAKKCKSGDPCVLAACDIATGKCKFKPIPDGVPCNDGTACTKSDSCLGGTCLGKVVDCDDGNKCTDDSCDSATGCLYSANGNGCDDGNLCTDGDGCKEGKCQGTAKVVAVDCDDGHPCTKDSCDPKKGCVSTATAGDCSDGNPCTKSDSCVDGGCKGGKSECQCESNSDCKGFEDGDLCNGTLICDKSAAPFNCKVDVQTVVTCSGAKDTDCLANKCDKTKGSCQLVPKSDGKTCDADADICTVGDKCSKGTCLAGPQQGCDDNNACTTDSCNAKDGCLHSATVGACSDGNACTEGDGCSNKVCLSGKKKACDDEVACTTDSCNKTSGKCVFTGIPGCGGFCATSKDCDDNKVCTTDLCIEGKCLLTNNSNACDDNNKCTNNDDCTDGLCAGKKTDCNDGNECTTDSCKAGIGCINQGHQLACEDGNLCTSGDQCANGTCKPGSGKVCDDSDKCTTDACDPKSGKCGSSPVFGCGGYCLDASHCNDKNVCTDDSCTVANGAKSGKCAHANNTKTCDDGDGCTTGDLCTSGVCKGGEGAELSTLAGSGTQGYKDDNPKIAQFSSPAGVVVSAGLVVVADRNNHSLRRIAADGLVSTLAGTGKPGYNDGYGKLAAFYAPHDVTVDSKGNFYVADTNNHRIRRVSPHGAVVTLAGSGKAGFKDGGSSDANFYFPRGVVATPLGAVFVADLSNHRLRRVAPDGQVTTIAGNGKPTSVDGNGINASVAYPTAVALRANGDLYFVEGSPSSRLRRVTQAGVVTTIAGNGDGVFDGVGASARFHDPSGIVVDSGGAILIADSKNHRIRKVSESGFVSTLIGFGGFGFKDGGPGQAQLNTPFGVVLDPQGRLYIGDLGNQRVRLLVDSTGNCNIDKKCYTTGLRKPGSPCLVCDPNASKTQWSKLVEGSVCHDGSYCTVAEKCNSQGACSGKSKSCDDGDACTNDVCDPATGACSHKATVGTCGYCTATGHCDDGNDCTDDACVVNQCQHKFNSAGCKSGNACSTGETCSQGKCVAEAAIGTTTVAGTGVEGATDGSANQAKFNDPARVAVGPDGAIYVADRDNHRIRRVSADGNTVITFAGGTSGYNDGKGVLARFSSPRGVDVAPDGAVYVADTGNHRIRKISKDGQVSTLSGAGTAGYKSGTSSATQFYSPYDVAVTLGGTVYVADTNNHRIRKVRPDGTSSSIAGGTYGFKDGKGSAAQFRSPKGVDADNHGVVFVADTTNHRIRRIAQDGAVTTIAGAGSGLLDGPVAKALFKSPHDVAVDGAGRIWVADTDNYRIRRFSIGGSVVTAAGSTYGLVDGVGAKSQFRGPTGITADRRGAIFIADDRNHVIRKVFDGSKSCAIAGGCWADAIPNPSQPCQKCQALKSSSQWSALAVGDVCDDGKPCVSDEVCDGKGACVGKAATCDDGDKCTVDSCEAGTGQCKFDKKLSHDCYCNTNSHCDDNNVCTDASCQSGKCVKTFNNKGCVSGEACSAGDTCSFGTCVALYSVVVTTACGNGYGNFGDGACASARFRYPKHTARGADGSYYVADTGFHRIRRIKDAAVQTLAGQGSAGYVNGIGSVARFHSPTGIGVDAQGALYVSDTGNHTIRKVSKTGLVSALSGNGQGGFADGPTNLARFNNPTDLYATAAGQVFVLDANNCRVRFVAADGSASTVAGTGSSGQADGAVSVATFRNMVGITLDSQGNIYVTQHSAPRIRRISTAGIVTTIAGQGGSGYADGAVGSAKINTPSGIAVDRAGAIYFTDSANHRVRKIANGQMSTLAGGSGGYTDSTGAFARLNYPWGLLLLPSGRLLVTDSNNHRLREVWDSADNCAIGGKCYKKTFGPKTSECEECQPAKNAKGWTPRASGASCEDGKACTSSACDAQSKCVAKDVDCDDKNPCTADSCSAWGVCVHKVTATCDDGDPCTVGETCVSGKCKPEIDRWVSWVCGQGYTNNALDGACSSGSTRLSYPSRVRDTADGRRWLFGASHRIRELTAKNEVKTFAGINNKAGFKNGYTNQALLNAPTDLVQLTNKDLIVADSGNHRLRKIDGNDYVSVFAGSTAGFKNGAVTSAQFNRPDAIVRQPGDVLFVADRSNDAVRRVHNGQVTTFTGGNGHGSTDGPAKSARFREISDMELDGHGVIWLVDRGSHSIRKITPDGTVTTVAGGTSGFADGTGSGARFNSVTGLAVAPDGRIYIADTSNHRIRVMTTAGVVTTFVGSGNNGYTNGTGSSARFNSPTDVMATSSGDILIVDTNNQRLRRAHHSLGRCFINGVCYGPDVVNPKAACGACDATKANAGWTTKPDGAACADGAPCTTGDKCAAGQCKGTASSCSNGCEAGTGACL